MKHIHGKTTTLPNVGEDRTLSPIYEASHQLQHYLAPLELEEAIDEWVQYYNEQRYYEALGNLNISGLVGTNPQHKGTVEKRLSKSTISSR